MRRARCALARQLLALSYRLDPPSRTHDRPKLAPLAAPDTAAQNAIARLLIDCWPKRLPGPAFTTRYALASRVVLWMIDHRPDGVERNDPPGRGV